MTLLKTPAEDRNSRVLGKAVHPGALRRLHELFPDATITVEHTVYKVPLEPGTMKMDGPRDREQHATRVWIDLEGDWQPNCGRTRPSSSIFADATCHPDDHFDRRKGIELAFRRALDTARRNHRSREWTRAQRDQRDQSRHIRGPAGLTVSEPEPYLGVVPG